MKQRLLYISFAFFLTGFTPFVSAQENPSFDTEFAAIDEELTKWDPVRGKWLGSSLKAMSSDEPIPDRTFPEDFSPGEMMRMVPEPTMNNIRTISQNQSQNSRDLLARERWSKIYNYSNRPSCKLIMGRTYGDPHLRSFDGASYSFQTVGEFELANANNGQMVVQVRQEPQRDDFSLNTAVAMKVGGDRLGIYTRDKRDAFNSPVMLNGMPIEIGSRTYYLPHGGTVSNSGNNYLVTWPTGEKVSVDMSRTGGMSFMNVAVQVYPCSSNRFSGLMGNANGDRRDDFDVNRTNQTDGVFSNGSNTDYWEKERLAFLAKDFANSHRISPQTSLFDYQFGENTMSYTDFSYPRVHRTFNDIPNDRRVTARNKCEASGLRGDDLQACMYDQAFLNIEPVRPPVIPSRTDRVTLEKVTRETPNVNPPREVPVIKDTREMPNGTINTKPVLENQKIDDKIESDVLSSPAKQTWESRETEERTPVNSQSGEANTRTEPTKTETKNIPVSNPTRTSPVSKPKPKVDPPKEAPKSREVKKTPSTRPNSNSPSIPTRPTNPSKRGG